jgi:hypothetical protein
LGDLAGGVQDGVAQGLVGVVEEVDEGEGGEEGGEDRGEGVDEGLDEGIERGQGRHDSSGVRGVGDNPLDAASCRFVHASHFTEPGKSSSRNAPPTQH